MPKTSSAGVETRGSNPAAWTSACHSGPCRCVQAIRSKGKAPRFYVYFPIPLAAAIGLRAGESVEWELLDRAELHLMRTKASPLRARRRARRALS